MYLCIGVSLFTGRYLDKKLGGQFFKSENNSLKLFVLINILTLYSVFICIYFQFAYLNFFFQPHVYSLKRKFLLISSRPLRMDFTCNRQKIFDE